MLLLPIPNLFNPAFGILPVLEFPLFFKLSIKPSCALRRRTRIGNATVDIGGGRDSFEPLPFIPIFDRDNFLHDLPIFVLIEIDGHIESGIA